jgi:hypothetical protein
MRWKASLAFIAAAAVVPFQSAQAATGFAYDSVTKFSMGSPADINTIEPDASFDQAFESASQTKTPSGKGGLFSIGKTLGDFQKMMKSGTAERHFYLGTKSRTDSLSSNSSTIVDCTAQTITYLDNDKKTYRVTPLYPSPGPASSPAPSAVRPSHTVPPDDGTRYVAKYTSAALGPKTVDGIATEAYSANAQITATKTTGETSETDVAFKTYLSGYAQPSAGCSRFTPPGNSQATRQTMQGNQMRDLIVQMMSKQKNWTVSASGPPIPGGKFAIFTVIQPSGTSSSGNTRGGITVISENGHVRTLTDADAAQFAIPAGYTLAPESPAP